LANKEITLNKDRIVIKKLIGSNLETIFSTDNFYLKTDPSGVLKAGGYERCPVIVGASSIVDDTRYGGFLAYESGGVNYTTDVTIELPSGASPTSVVGFPPPLPVPYINLDSPVLNLKDTNGSNIGTFKWHLDGRGFPPNQGYPPGPLQRAAYVKDVNVTSIPSNNTYVFPYYSITAGLQWYNLNNSTWITVTYDPAANFVLSMKALVTIPAKSLSLAVTV
jgi:hypothetical protein